ncbi:hypothetical protein KRR38_32410 [Novosphingobium sp. G106]|uniref:hypothetical protein n=1 Tax=Novosphingobium sp. G106 TaxID=2849500 RepID=UPI001C2D1075|nr:hypothetical protein [Novosphingobium sp. G106]MBV1692240.1 hypothetical protein [Novosphingobium sp. G106]
MARQPSQSGAAIRRLFQTDCCCDRDELTPQQLDAIAGAHSGLAEVVIQEWAILLRCRGGCPVATAELVHSLLHWFSCPLSAPELSDFLERLIARDWLVCIDDGRAFHTTGLGEEVLAQTEPALVRGTLWNLLSGPNSSGGSR